MSTTYELLMICGSLRAGSTNEAVLRTAAAVAPEGVRAVHYAGLAELPHFNPDHDRDPLPPAVADLRARIAAADGLLFCTPEYAGALPGSFKNLLDWTVGGVEISDKPTGWINAAGPNRGAAAHDSLRAVLGYTGADIVPGACARIPVAPQLIAQDGLIHDPAIRARLTEALTALRRHTPDR